MHFDRQNAFQMHKIIYFMTEFSLNKNMCAYTLPKIFRPITVNLEIFARILFSRMALKDIFATFKIHD